MTEGRQEAGGTSKPLVAPGRLDRDAAKALLAQLDSRLKPGAPPLTMDLSATVSFDSPGLAVLVMGLTMARERECELRFHGASQEILDYFSLISVDQLSRRARQVKEPEPLIVALGGLALPGVNALRHWFHVMVETFWGMFVRPWKGEKIRWDRVANEMVAVGVQAVPIIMLIGFLIGIILVMQTAGKLREFGAEVYVADIVGVSVTREIGPLLAAIIAASRSGSAIAAEIGTMVVSEEVDALRQMGIHPVRFLVLPKVVALAVAVPCLFLFFTIPSIVGGLMFGVSVLDLPWAAYLSHTQNAVSQADVVESAFKCSIFGAVIGQVGCALGLGVRGGSVGVGKATTFAVVLSIFLIIVFDAIFVAVFRLI